MASKKRERVPVKSRQWSCSELVEGHKELVSTKMERESDDELQGKIQDPYEKHGVCHGGLVSTYSEIKFYGWLQFQSMSQEYEAQLEALKNQRASQLYT